MFQSPSPQRSACANYTHSIRVNVNEPQPNETISSVREGRVQHWVASTYPPQPPEHQTEADQEPRHCTHRAALQAPQATGNNSDMSMIADRDQQYAQKQGNWWRWCERIAPSTESIPEETREHRPPRVPHAYPKHSRSAKSKPEINEIQTEAAVRHQTPSHLTRCCTAEQAQVTPLE
jgi:hypothetical protein